MTELIAPPEVRSKGGRPIRVSRQLAAGGEGAVYGVVKPPGTVLKRYHDLVLSDKGAELEAKLEAMIAMPPVNPVVGRDHVSIAWPREIVVDTTTSFVGYLMPEIDTASSTELHQVSNPSDRKRPSKNNPWVAGFSWEYLLRTASNLAAACHALHETGHVVGDFNERNILVSKNALVTFVDCDSMQIRSKTGRMFLCTVYRPEFTAPELLNVDLNKTVRAPASDLFALAVHIYQLLMEGRHPFAGVWNGPDQLKPDRSTLAARGLFVQAGDPQLTPPAGTPDFALLPPDVRQLFRRAFLDGAQKPRSRPTGLEWFDALSRLADSLVTCGVSEGHRYPGRLGSKCPWCALEKTNRATSNGGTRPQQLPLPDPALRNRPSQSRPHHPQQHRPPPQQTHPSLPGWIPPQQPQQPGWIAPSQMQYPQSGLIASPPPAIPRFKPRQVRTGGGYSLPALLAPLCAFLGYVAPLGLVLGIIGLRQCRRSGMRGRRLALIGIVVSVPVTLLLIFGAVAGATLHSTAPAAAPIASATMEQRIQAFETSKGYTVQSVTCPNDLPAVKDAAVRCSLQHKASTYGVTVKVTSVDSSGGAKWTFTPDSAPTPG